MMALYINTNANMDSIQSDKAMEIIGAIGGTCISCSLIPQVLLTYKTKSVDDISYCYQGIYILGTGMVNMYAIYFGLWAVYIPCLLEFSLIVLLTIMKRAYTGRKDADDAFVENASQPRHISPRLSAGVSSRRLSVEMEDSSLAQTWKSTRDLVSKSTRNLMMKDQVKQSTAELSDVEKDDGSRT